VAAMMRYALGQAVLNFRTRASVSSARASKMFHPRLRAVSMKPRRVAKR
jgi:hypothetical protein